MTEDTTREAGMATGWPLNDLSPLTQPWHADAWGHLRPEPTPALLCLAAELARAAYAMDVMPWMRAGWRDVTIQLDGDLTDGLMNAEEKTGNVLERFWASWKLRRVQSRLKQKRPLGQMLGAVRQIRGGDSGKAVVMLHPMPDGRYVVAIGFMGTGEQAYDWISNFRITAEDGTHRGFLQLCRQFEANEEQITFPRTATELGLEKLTLRHILEECRHENSRFLLFLAGHSQGGAVLQVWAQRKMEEDGVLPRNIVGCGFASPTVATGCGVRSAAAYPLLHVVNSDDLVPRMGAALHLGEVLIYDSDAALRESCYAWPMDAESVRRRAMARNVVSAMVDTPSCLVAVRAYLQLLASYPVEAVAENLRFLQARIRPVQRLAGAVDAGVDSLLLRLARWCGASYQAMTGRPMSPKRVARMQRHLAQLAGQMGVKELGEVLSQLAAEPHAMVARGDRPRSPYAMLALLGEDALVPAHWMTGQRPVLLREDGRMPGICQHRCAPVRRPHRQPHRAAARARADCRNWNDPA